MFTILSNWLEPAHAEHFLIYGIDGAQLVGEIFTGAHGRGLYTYDLPDQFEKVELASPDNFDLSSLTREQRFEKVAEVLINRGIGPQSKSKENDPTIKVFFDTEFTHLFEPLLPEPAELISIGCISEDGQQFYAENSDFSVEHCSQFVIDTVIPLLEGGDRLMPYGMVAKQLRSWVQSFNAPVSFLTDSPCFDWPFVEHLFNYHGWPNNLINEPLSITFHSAIQSIRFQNLIEQTFETYEPRLRRHHALDDAIANRHAYIKIKKKE